jgi:hypothetical protein
MDDLASEARALRVEMHEEFRDVRQELRELHGELSTSRRWTVNLWATTVIGFVAVLIQVGLR